MTVLCIVMEDDFGVGTGPDELIVESVILLVGVGGAVVCFVGVPALTILICAVVGGYIVTLFVDG